MLQRWWSKKYRLPPNSKEFKNYTEEELWVEFYEDYYAAEPNKGSLDLEEGENVQFVTGDPEIDELEKRIANDDITQEEVQEMLSSWVESPPEQIDESFVPVDIGEGFNDTNPRSK